MGDADGMGGMGDADGACDADSMCDADGMVGDEVEAVDDDMAAGVAGMRDGIDGIAEDMLGVGDGGAEDDIKADGVADGMEDDIEAGMEANSVVGIAEGTTGGRAIPGRQVGSIARGKGTGKETNGSVVSASQPGPSGPPPAERTAGAVTPDGGDMNADADAMSASADMNADADATSGSGDLSAVLRVLSVDAAARRDGRDAGALMEGP